MRPLPLGAKIGVGFGTACLGLLLIGLYYTLTARAPVVPAPAILPQPNGYDFYVAAARALSVANPPVDAINDGTARSPAEIALNYSPARRQKWLDSNAKSWDLLDRAIHTPTRNALPRGAVSSVKGDYTSLRALARGQNIRIENFKAHKQWDAALSSGLDTLQMGRDIERGGDLLASLVGIAIEAIGEQELEDLPPHLSANQAAQGARRLERLIAGAALFSAVLSEEKWGRATRIATDWEKPGNRGAGFIGHLLFPKARVMRSYNALLDEFIAQADKPALLQTPIAAPALWNAPNRVVYPSLSRSFFNDQRRKTKENSLLLRLALRAYQAQNGAFPAKIEAIMPKYLAKIPIDPFGRGEAMRFEAMRFRKVGDSYQLWSIGPDKIDDHGAPILNKLGQKPRFFVPESRGDAVVGP